MVLKQCVACNAVVSFLFKSLLYDEFVETIRFSDSSQTYLFISNASSADYNDIRFS